MTIFNQMFHCFFPKGETYEDLPPMDACLFEVRFVVLTYLLELVECRLADETADADRLLSRL